MWKILRLSQLSGWTQPCKVIPGAADLLSDHRQTGHRQHSAGSGFCLWKCQVRKQQATPPPSPPPRHTPIALETIALCETGPSVLSCSAGLEACEGKVLVVGVDQADTRDDRAPCDAAGSRWERKLVSGAAVDQTQGRTRQICHSTSRVGESEIHVECQNS